MVWVLELPVEVEAGAVVAETTEYVYEPFFLLPP